MPASARRLRTFTPPGRRETMRAFVFIKVSFSTQLVQQADIGYNKNDWSSFIIRTGVAGVNKGAMGMVSDMIETRTQGVSCCPGFLVWRNGNDAKNESGSQRGATHPDSQRGGALFCPARLL